MDGNPKQSGSTHLVALGAIGLLFLLLSVIGVGWGLPSRSIDPYLFAGEKPWSGKKIHRLAGAADKFSRQRGADVDPDPLEEPIDRAVALTDTDEKIAKIYLRYRLYTYQPDEMITMMALAGMNPRQLQLDPRLYQYGGLFIYPVGGLVGLCGTIGLINVRSDVVYYLDNPDEFGKFYVVSRAYAAAWGLIGVFVVFAIGRRLGGTPAGLLAALLFTLMPVVICMAHEGKPHLPGAVLMLMAVYCAMRHRAMTVPGSSASSTSLGTTSAPASPLIKRGSRGVGSRQENLPQPLLSKEGGCETSAETASPTADAPRSLRMWWLMCICGGGATGMVLSSWPIMVLIPLVAILDSQALRRATNSSRNGKEAAAGAGAIQSMSKQDSNHRARYVLRRTLHGGLIATAVYLMANPYILINALTNRAVLASNFGNSLAMYRIDRITEGFIRTVQLTVEGATLPVVVLGTLMLLIAIIKKNKTAVPLTVTAALFLLQFVCIGAGKPAEYGRFGVFTNTALAIATACLVTARLPGTRVRWIKSLFILMAVVWEGSCGAAYLWNFHRDSIGDGSRMRVRRAAPYGPWTGPGIGEPRGTARAHQSPKRGGLSPDHQDRPETQSDKGPATTADAFEDDNTLAADPWRALNEGSTVYVTAEPAPYSCPPLPFHHLDLRLLPDASKTETTCSERPNDCLALRTVDHTTLGPTGPPGVVVQPRPHILPDLSVPEWWFTRRQTPISWANKPIEVWTAGVPFAP